MTAPNPPVPPPGPQLSKAQVPPQAVPPAPPYVPPQPGPGAWPAPAGPARGTLAEWGPRALALLVDTGALLAVYVVGLVLSSIVGSISGALGVLVLLATVAAYIGAWVLNLVEQGQTGQSLGKRVVGLKLVREQDGQVTGAGLSVGRGFAHCLEFGIGWLWPLFDDKKQTFADKICSTVVVHADKADWRPALLRR